MSRLFDCLSNVKQRQIMPFKKNLISLRAGFRAHRNRNWESVRFLLFMILSEAESDETGPDCWVLPNPRGTLC